MIEIPATVHTLVHENPEVAYEYGLLVKSYDDPNQIIPNVRGFLTALGYEEPADTPRKPRERFSGEARRTRKRITVAVPTDRENGGQLWDEILAAVKLKLDAAGLINPDNYPDPQKYPAYEALVAALWDWLTDA